VSCDWPCRVVRLEACDLCPGFVRSRVPGGAVNHVDEFFLESIRRRGTWAASICGLQVSSEVYVRVAMLRFEVFGLFLGRRIAYGFLICCFACVLVPGPNTGHYVGQAVLCTLHSFQMKGGQFNFFSTKEKLAPGPQLHSLSGVREIARLKVSTFRLCRSEKLPRRARGRVPKWCFAATGCHLPCGEALPVS